MSDTKPQTRIGPDGADAEPVTIMGHEVLKTDPLRCLRCGRERDYLGEFHDSCPGEPSPAARCVGALHDWLAEIEAGPEDLSEAGWEHLEWARSTAGTLRRGPVKPVDAHRFAVHFGVLEGQLTGDDAVVLRQCQQLLAGIEEFAGGER